MRLEQQRPASRGWRNPNEHQLFTTCHVQQLAYSSRNKSRPSGRFRYRRGGSMESNNHDQRNELYYSQNKTQNNRNAISNKEAISEHLAALKHVFDRVVIEQFLSRASLEEAVRLYNQFRTTILAKKPGAQVTLYGSVSFACCLNDSAVIDIDVQCNGLLPYNTLREVLEIVHNSGLYKNIRLNTDHEPCCISLVVPETNIHIRVTSNYNRGIYSSEMIRLYIRFDPRVLPLLRLFRFFAKICSLDKPDLGTLHPIVFHLMLIHFLQQIQEPVLPCLHEYVFGADNILVTPSDDHTNEFQSKEDEVEDLQDTDNTYSLEEDIIEQPLSFDTLVEHLDENQKRIFKLEYQRQVREFNGKMLTIINDFKLLSTSDSSTLFLADNVTDEPHSQKLIGDCHVSVPSIVVNPQSVQLEEIIATNILSSLEAISLDNSVQGIHEFQAKNFGADKGAPSVCTVCYRSNHIKSECPELSLLEIIDLPKIEKIWSDVLSCLCRKMAEECKPTKEGIEERETILNYLEMEFRKTYPNSRLCAYGSFYNGFGLQHSDLDICVLLELNKKETTIQVLENLAQSMESNKNIFRAVEIVRSARVPIVRSIHLQSSIEIDISLNNTLPIENTRLLKMYSDIDPRVRELGSVMKTLAKKCDIGDASRGTLSSYAYTIMVIHFLQQIQPPVVPVLQQLNDVQLTNTPIIRKCANWNIYFYDDLTKLNQVWSGYGLNTLSSGALWIEFLRYYTEQFDYEKHIVTIRQYEPLLRFEKGWFRPTIAIEDPFLLTHNLADRLSLQKWATIRRVFLHARQQFCSQPNIIDINMSKPNMEQLQEYLFNKHALCPEIADKNHPDDKKKYHQYLNI
ncbi:unnamed protein product [Rotaria sordida]|uniref:PAP-associated domain-containing protein n=1 Tax=Rotaria sordida TaxID=392033 RepID=A0A814SVW6_9BILA|nr:unnamed protein product [Rotaria sordida]